MAQINVQFSLNFRCVNIKLTYYVSITHVIFCICTVMCKFKLHSIILPGYYSCILYQFLINYLFQGRVKVIQDHADQKADSENTLEPTPDFDSHVSRRFQRGKKMAYDFIYDASQVTFINNLLCFSCIIKLKFFF